jgi:hypothetical protein
MVVFGPWVPKGRNGARALIHVKELPSGACFYAVIGLLEVSYVYRIANLLSFCRMQPRAEPIMVKERLVDFNSGNIAPRR